MSEPAKPSKYILRQTYNCKGWGAMAALVPNRAWVLDKISLPPGAEQAEYLETGDELFVDATAGEIQVKRAGVVVHTLTNLHLDGMGTTPNLWAKAHQTGYDVYLYLLDSAGSARKIHVDVFYPQSQYDQDRPGPATVEVEA